MTEHRVRAFLQELGEDRGIKPRCGPLSNVFVNH
jgi:hypothetical protein